ncbi:MAG: ASCH domain-containing protein [Desulfurococcaceae archaeon]
MPKSRVKFFGRHIMLKGAYIEKLLSNEKKATIRKGIYRPKYSEVIIHAGGKPVAKARITRVYYRRLKELGEYEARLEGFKNTSELVEELRRVYGDINEDDYFTVIEFEIIQKLNDLTTEDPYYGLTPSDIARIALRYLSGELNENEKKILIDLTRTNSIRKTAVNLFKDLNKRALVRRTLRRTLRLLIEKNLIHVKTIDKLPSYNHEKGGD